MTTNSEPLKFADRPKWWQDAAGRFACEIASEDIGGVGHYKWPMDQHHGAIRIVCNALADERNTLTG